MRRQAQYLPNCIRHPYTTLEESPPMTTTITSSRSIEKKRIANYVGALFVVLCLIASALSIGIPHSSSAATAPIIYSPDVDVSVAQSTPTTSTPRSSQLLAVGGTSQRQSFIRFTVGGLSADAVIQAVKLRLVVTNDSSGKPASRASATTAGPRRLRGTPGRRSMARRWRS